MSSTAHPIQVMTEVLGDGSSGVTSVAKLGCPPDPTTYCRPLNRSC